MIHYFSDDDNIVGFYQVEQDPAKVAKKVSVITGTTYEVIKCDKYEDIGSFEMDTLIIRSNLFSEDFIDLLDYGIAIYIIDY